MAEVAMLPNAATIDDILQPAPLASPRKDTMTLSRIFSLAVANLGKGSMESSARLCLEDARRLEERGDYENARKRALKSLAYSVGILHPDYCKAAS